MTLYTDRTMQYSNEYMSSLKWIVHNKSNKETYILYRNVFSIKIISWYLRIHNQNPHTNPAWCILQALLTNWGRVTHICVSKPTSIGSDNGLSPGWRQAIIWTNTGLLIGPLWINFSEILIEIHEFSFKKIHLKMLSAKWRPFCLSLNVLKWRTEMVILFNPHTSPLQ